MAVAMGQPGMQITQAAWVERWNGDNVDWQARAKARRARAVDMQRVKIPDTQWEYFLARWDFAHERTALQDQWLRRVGIFYACV